MLNNRSFLSNILGFKTFSKSEPRSPRSVPRDLQFCGRLLGGSPASSSEAASCARGFGLSATESGSQKPCVPHQHSQGSRRCMQCRAGAGRAWVWLLESTAPGQPRAASYQTDICVCFEFAYVKPK